MIDFNVCISGFVAGLFVGLTATLIDIFISTIARIMRGS